MTMKSIYSYEKYRVYLKDFYLFQKETNPSYTYARFAVEAGLKSLNYLKLVIDGDRNLTSANIFQFAKALKLNYDTLVFFEALVLREQASSTEEKKYYNQRLSQLRNNKPRKGIRLKLHEFISRWYFPAVVLAIDGKSESTDLSAISQMVGITPKELNESLDLLKQKGIVTIKEGRYSSQANHIVYHDPKLSNVFQKKYLKEQLALSLEVFQNRYTRDAKFYSHTFTIPAADFAYYESRLNSYVEDLIAKADQGPAEKMAQLNLQFFKLGE